MAAQSLSPCFSTRDRSKRSSCDVHGRFARGVWTYGSGTSADFEIDESSVKEIRWSDGMQVERSGCADWLGCVSILLLAGIGCVDAGERMWG